MDKKPEGRPSLYKQEFASQLLEYFGREPYTRDERGVERASDFPSLAGFAIQIGVHRDTLHEWSKVHPEFSDAYKRAKDFQENYLAVNGNRDLISTAFGIFTAKNVLKWRDKQPDEVDVIVNNIAELTPEQRAARIDELTLDRKKISGAE